MIARLLSLVVFLAALICGTVALAQDVIVYRPIEGTMVAPLPAMSYGGPVYVQRPVVVRPPVVVYRPVVPAPAITVYSPAYPQAVVTAPPVVTTVARPLVIRPKVYVRGQPVRNILRAVTP